MTKHTHKWRIHQTLKRGGHNIDLGRRSPWWRGRQEGAGHHHHCWSQFLAGYIHPVWWHPPDDGRQNGGGGEVAQQQHAARRGCSSSLPPGCTTTTCSQSEVHTSKHTSKHDSHIGGATTLGLIFKELTSEELELAQQGGAWLLHWRKECLSQVAREKVKGESESPT